MRYLRLIALLVFAASVLPIVAQEGTTDCSPLEVNRQIDTWYNNYLGQRGEVDAQEALGAANEFSTNIEGLVTACGLVEAAGEEAVIEQTGLGTFESPYVVGAPAVAGDSTVTITEVLRPADEVLDEDGALLTLPPAGQEYIIVYMDITCASFSAAGCYISLDSFRLKGSLGVVYYAMVEGYSEYLPEGSPMVGGSTRSGGVPFLINSNDSNLLLSYYPEGNASEPTADPAYFLAQEGELTGVEVSAMVDALPIRVAPDATSTAVGELALGGTAIAIARNVDGTWIKIQTPTAAGWVGIETIQTLGDLMSLPVSE